MTPDLPQDLSGLSSDTWFDRLDEVGDEHGYLERLGPDHAALFIDAGPRLLVTFELRSRIEDRAGATPLGFDLVQAHGWSLLTIIAEDDTWFRSRFLYGYFDRLIDDGFFEDFDDVLFFGAHEGGYAAGAFSVAAPGCRVLMLRPVASLAPSVAGWDRRYMAARKLDFSSRFGYAPDMLDAVEAGYVCYDPQVPVDAIHAALFRRPNVTMLRARLARPRIEAALENMDALAGVIADAMEGTLTTQRFARAWRARRNNPVYLRSLLKRLEVDERSGLAARVCRFGQTTATPDFFRDKLIQMERATPPLNTAAQ